MVLSLMPINAFGALNEPNSDVVGIASVRDGATVSLRIDLADLEGFTTTGEALALVVSMVNRKDDGDDKREIIDVDTSAITWRQPDGTAGSEPNNVFIGTAEKDAVTGSWVIPVTSASLVFSPRPSNNHLAHIPVEMEFGDDVTTADIRVDVLVHGLVVHTIIRPTRVLDIPGVGVNYTLASAVPNFDARLDAPVIRITEQSTSPENALRTANRRIEIVLPRHYRVVELPFIGLQLPELWYAGSKVADFVVGAQGYAEHGVDHADRVILIADLPSPVTGILPQRLEIRDLRIVPMANAPTDGDVSIRLNVGGRSGPLNNTGYTTTDANRYTMVIGTRGVRGTDVTVTVPEEVPALEAAVQLTNWSAPITISETTRGAWDSSLINLSTLDFRVPDGVRITGVQFRQRTANHVNPSWTAFTPNDSAGLASFGAGIDAGDWGRNDRNTGVMNFGEINNVHITSPATNNTHVYAGERVDANRASFTLVLPRAQTGLDPSFAARQVEIRFRFSISPGYALENTNIPVTVTGTAIGGNERPVVVATTYNQIRVSRMDPTTLLPTTRDMFDLVGPFPLPRLLIEEREVGDIRVNDWIYIMMHQGLDLWGGSAFGLGMPSITVNPESGFVLGAVQAIDTGPAANHGYRVRVDAVGGADRDVARIVVGPPATGVNTWRMTGPLLSWMEEFYNVDVYLNAAGGDRRTTNIRNIATLTSLETRTFSTRPFQTQVVEFPQGEADIVLGDEAPGEGPGEGPGETTDTTIPVPSITISRSDVTSDGLLAIESVNGTDFVRLRHLIDDVLGGMVSSTRNADGVALALFSAPHAAGAITNISIEGRYPNHVVAAMVGLTPVPVPARNIDGGWYVNIQALATLFGIMPEVTP
jgi:hypothetical protein